MKSLLLPIILSLLVVFTNCRGVPIAVTSRDLEVRNGVLFKYRGEAKSLVISGMLGITSIGKFAFLNSKIEKLILPEGITRIEETAFSNCKNLVELDLPNSLRIIEKNAFYGCNINIEIPASVTQIDFSTSPFNADENAGGITFSINERNPRYTSIDGVIFSKDETALLFYQKNKPDTSYDIPRTVKTIGKSAFNGARNLTSITIPQSVTTIEDEAFCRTGITALNFPPSVSSIGQRLFANCENLAAITIPNGVITELGALFFVNCASLVNVNIPASVQKIAKDAFLECPRLEKITVSRSTAIDEEAIKVRGKPVTKLLADMGLFEFYNPGLSLF